MNGNDPVVPGAICTIYGGDLGIDPDARPFLCGVECVIVKQTRAGKVQVMLPNQPRKVYSFPKTAVHTDDSVAADLRRQAWHRERHPEMWGA